jgi:hypothetical protein
MDLVISSFFPQKEEIFASCVKAAELASRNLTDTNRNNRNVCKNRTRICIFSTVAQEWTRIVFILSIQTYSQDEEGLLQDAISTCHVRRKKIY